MVELFCWIDRQVLGTEPAGLMSYRANYPDLFRRAAERPNLIIVAGVIRKNAPKVIFVEHDHVVRALDPVQQIGHHQYVRI
jgi:hypothetical protein